MTNLRKEARGRECTIRVPGYCNRDESTTVLCHYPLAGISGAKLKSPDLMAAFGCSSCHDIVDLRVRSRFTHEEVRLMHAEGVMRTQYILIKEGKIHES